MLFVLAICLVIFPNEKDQYPRAIVVSYRFAYLSIIKLGLTFYFSSGEIFNGFSIGGLNKSKKLNNYGATRSAMALFWES